MMVGGASASGTYVAQKWCPRHIDVSALVPIARGKTRRLSFVQHIRPDPIFKMMSSLGRRCPPAAISGAAAATLLSHLLGERKAAHDDLLDPDDDSEAAEVSPSKKYTFSLAGTRTDSRYYHDEQKALGNHEPVVLTGSLLPLHITSNTCACEGGDGGYKFNLRRHQTMQMLSETSTAATLKSRYDVDWDNPLGEGAFGAVYLCTNRDTGQKYALKKISKRLTNKSSFMREIDALMHIRESGGHPNICRLIENFDEGGNYYLVLDLISGGELFDQLARSGPYSEADAARLVREVASALAYLHGVGIVHSDLKPENIMLSTPNKTDAVIKVVDLGTAEITEKADKKMWRRSGGNTPAYAPPEAFGNVRGALSPRYDMWALGIIVYIMLTGMHPFDLDGRATDEEIEEKIRQRKSPPLRNSPITAHLSDSAIDLIERLMAWWPRRRMTAMQMLEHPWVRGETARTKKIAESDKRLKLYKPFQTKLEAKVFSDWCTKAPASDEAKQTSLIERAFNEIAEGKGYVTTSDLNRTLSNGNKGSPGGDGKVALGLSGFSDLLSDHMESKYYPRGHTIYKQGAKGDAIYFINSGTVEVSTKDGFRTKLSQGDLFGEGALLDPNGRRSASITCLTPVHAIRIGRDYFEKYVRSSDELNLRLRERDRFRKRDRAKTILRQQKNMREFDIAEGEVLFEHGDEGNALYIVEEGKLDLKSKGGDTVLSIGASDICGLHALLMNKPRNTTAICASEKCTLLEMLASDFFRLYNSSDSIGKSLREVAARRDFLKAIVTLTGKTFKDSHLREAFDAVDLDQSGAINLLELKELLNVLDPTLSDKVVQNVMEAMDINSSGTVTWEEFHHIFNQGDS